MTGTVTPGTSLSTATPTAVSVTNPGQNAFYTFTVTAAEVSAGDVITAQVLDDSGLGGTVAIYGPKGGAFYSSVYGGNQIYVTGQVNTPGTYTFAVLADNSTGSEELEVIFPVNVTGTVTPGTSLSTATPTAVSITDPGQIGLYTFTVTAAEVSAGDDITAQVLDDSGLGGSIYILGPDGGGAFYSSGYGGNQTYVTGSVDTPGTYTFVVAANNSTGSEELKVAI